MKPISITLERLRDGTMRATGRIEGGTSAVAEGGKDSGYALVKHVMRETCSEHRVGDCFDMTHIQLNDAAQAAISH